MRPQFNAQACIARIGREVNRITHQGRKELPRIAVVVLVGGAVVGIDIFDVPTAVVGGVVSPQFNSATCPIGVKINDIANEIGHVPAVIVGSVYGSRPVFEVPSWIRIPTCSVGSVKRVELIALVDKLFSSEIHNISHNHGELGVWKRHCPPGAVSARLVDERRSNVHVGIVGPGVVLWDVFERTRSLVVDGDRNGGRGRTARVVGPNRVGCRRCLENGRNTPNRSVARSEVESSWQGCVDFPRGDGT